VQAAFGAAEARATIAGRHLDAAQASERISAERRAALKLPVVRCR
jgi:hypothetical protein